MSTPAAMTWSILLPPDTQFVSSPGVPGWFADLLTRKNGSRTVPVYCRQDVSRVRDDAFVAINCRGLKYLDVRYASVRRFAVLPSLQKARWFVPLDSPAVSSAAFSLYSPAKFSARLKVGLARGMVRSRVPLWHRDEIVIAQQEVPALQQQAEALFPDETIHLALSAGAPEPARNRKISAAIISDAGEVMGFAKIAGSELSDQLVRREAQLLESLENTGIRQISPRLIFAGELDGAYILVQALLPGTVTAAAFTPLHHELLKAMQHGPIQPAASCAMFARLSEAVRAHPQLESHFDSILPILETTQVPSTIVHGDFAPWNLRRHNGALCAFDWEYGELDALPFIDELHFHMQIGHEMQHWSPSHARGFLQQHAEKHPLGLSREQVQAIQQIYLIDQLSRLYGEGYDRSNDMVAWYEDLLALVAPAPRKEAVLA